MCRKLSILVLLLLFVNEVQLKAQVYPGSRPVTCVERNISRKKFFRMIQRQTAMSAFYVGSLPGVPEKLSPNIRNQPLDRVLTRLLQRRGYRWCYRGDNLIIFRKKSSR